MKKILLSICFILITISVFATDVSGNQSGVWNLAGSPYHIIGEITIPTNETLQIEAGVEVIAMGNYKITALGNILAIGTFNDTIRFHGNNELNWGGLRLEDEVTTSQFNYCRISNTDDTNDYGIQSINSPVTINHSYLDDHQKAVSFSALSSNDPSVMIIINSKIAYVQKSGITITDNSIVLIDSCEVTRCGLGAQFYGAIQLSLQNNSHSCSPIITNNYIHHNDKQGITLANLYGYDNMAPTVENNEISYNYTGIYLYVGKGYYAGNHIHHNFVENNADSGAGVMLYGNGADAVFTHNEVNNNYTGFYLSNGATANIGDLNNGSSMDDGYNLIYDNEFYTGEIFSVYNASALDMIAENNYWGSDDPEIIDITIIDGNDNPAYGIVDYEPYLSHILNPPQNPNANSSGYITWEEPEPGSTSPFLYYNVYLDGELYGTTNELFYQLVDLVYGQQYMVGLSAQYEAGESVILEFELPYVNSDDNAIQIVNTLHNYPNPFNPNTTISFNLTTEHMENTEIVIYNLKGQKVKTFECHTELVEVQHSITWDGTDESNKPVSSGVYFYKLVSDGKNLASKKMLLLK
ncbi:MAG: right-handed parallel beta-helix repeat-containing protein [Candidatus Cloacimonetes bacterium]|nr:right-handed parallel beta-helix repeat-containing protein [Candidatus Cloacimonadota bacterium]